jgi:hypothetical protein
MRKHAVFSPDGPARMLTHGGSVADVRGARILRTDYGEPLRKNPPFALRTSAYATMIRGVLFPVERDRFSWTRLCCRLSDGR